MMLKKVILFLKPHQSEQYSMSPMQIPSIVHYVGMQVRIAPLCQSVCCEPWAEFVEFALVLVGFAHFSWILAQTWGLRDSLLSCKRTRWTLMNCGDIIL